MNNKDIILDRMQQLFLYAIKYFSHYETHKNLISWVGYCKKDTLKSHFAQDFSREFKSVYSKMATLLHWVRIPFAFNSAFLAPYTFF